MNLKTTNLTKSHYKKDFDCGKELLNNYLKTQAKQDVKKKLAACFVYTERENNVEKVLAYYTLSASSIPSDLVPEEHRKHFPKNYKSLPVTLLGRLAVDKSKQGYGLGKKILIDAMYRGFINISEVASFALIVDPLDKEAISFYSKYGFILLDSGKMFLPWSTIEKVL